MAGSPDFIPDDQAPISDEEKYGSGILNPIKAAALGAARAGSFGLSDVFLSKSRLVRPETLSGLEEQQPEASFVGEAGAIGASLLVPGYGEATAARAATAPIRAANRIGQAITHGVEASLPKATGVLGKASSVALSQGLGLGAEGALYGVGRSLTDFAENRLGNDPETAAEHIASNIGMSALLAGGLGAGLGLGGAAAKAGFDKAKSFMPGGRSVPLPDAGPAIIETKLGPEAVISAPVGTMDRSMQQMGLPEADRIRINQGLNKLKPNAKHIIEESKIAGLSPIESQITSDTLAQKLQSQIYQAPSTAGDDLRQVVDANWRKAGKNFEVPLSTGETQSAHELGQAQKELLKEQLDATYKPIKEGYNKLDDINKAIDIPEEPRLMIVSDLLEEAENATKGSVGGPRQKQFEHWAERITEQKSLSNFDALESEIGAEERAAWRAGKYKDAEALSDVKKKVQQFNREQITEAHIRVGREAGLTEKEAKSLADSMIAQGKEMDKRYAMFVENIGDLAGVAKLGKARTYREVMEAIEKIEPSKLAANVFRGDRVNALRKLEKEFPAAFELFKVQYKKELLESLVKDGAVSPTKAAKEIAAIPKEIKSMLFSPEEIKVMSATKTWLDALPPRWGPSGTPEGMMYIDKYMHPIKTGVSEIVDAMKAQYVKASAQEIHAINQVESAAKKSIKEIISKSKEIFSGANERKGSAIGLGAKEIARDRSQKEEIINQVRQLRANPDKFVALLEESTKDIYDVTPRTASSIHSAAVRAVNYLAAAAPETESPYPLGQKPSPSKYEMRVFDERLKLLDNPSMVLDELRSGTLVPAHVEAIQSVYPKLYAEMQTAVMDRLTTAIQKKEMIPYQTKNMLSLFLNQDLYASITSQAIVQNQAAILRGDQQQAQEQMVAGGGQVRTTQKGLGEIDKSQQAMTAMQKSSQRANT